MGLRERIIQSARLKTKVRDVPEWDTCVVLQGLRAWHRAEVVKLGAQGESDALLKSYPLIVVFGVFVPASEGSPDLVPLFERGDEETLKDQPSHLVEALALEIIELSGLGKAAEKELAKNS